MRQILLFSDQPQVQNDVKIAAQAAGWRLQFASSQPDVLAYLVQQQPILTVIDLRVQSIDWRQWVLTAKTSPATRKQPILAFGAAGDATVLAQALQAGCDAALSDDDFGADCLGALLKHIRPDQNAELMRQAALLLPPLAQQGLAHFNAGDYYEQHELFEHAWRAEPGPVRQLYQGILQVGVAYYQIQRKNYNGARKMFMRSWQYLNALPDVCQGVNVAQLRHDALAAQTALETLGPTRIAEFDMQLLKEVKSEK